MQDSPPIFFFVFLSGPERSERGGGSKKGSVMRKGGGTVRLSVCLSVHHSDTQVTTLAGKNSLFSRDIDFSSLSTFPKQFFCPNRTILGHNQGQAAGHIAGHLENLNLAISGHILTPFWPFANF